MTQTASEPITQKSWQPRSAFRLLTSDFRPLTSDFRPPTSDFRPPSSQTAECGPPPTGLPQQPHRPNPHARRYGRERIERALMIHHVERRAGEDQSAIHLEEEREHGVD